MFRITGHDSGQAPEASTEGTGNDAYPNSLSLTPTGGAKEYLWISVEANDDDDNVTGYPSNMPDNQNYLQVATVTMGRATDNENAASFDPAQFTIAAGETWEAVTVAVHPVGVQSASKAKSAEFEVQGSGSKELSSEFTIQRTALIQMSAEFSAIYSGTIQLSSELLVQSSSSDELSKELVVQNLASATLPTEFAIQRAADTTLPSRFGIPPCDNIMGNWTGREACVSTCTDRIWGTKFTAPITGSISHITAEFDTNRESAIKVKLALYDSSLNQHRGEHRIRPSWRQRSRDRTSRQGGQCPRFHL